jgi:hypothetical protein
MPIESSKWKICWWKFTVAPLSLDEVWPSKHNHYTNWPQPIQNLPLRNRHIRPFPHHKQIPIKPTYRHSQTQHSITITLFGPPTSSLYQWSLSVSFLCLTLSIVSLSHSHDLSLSLSLSLQRCGWTAGPLGRGWWWNCGRLLWWGHGGLVATMRERERERNKRTKIFK